MNRDANFCEHLYETCVCRRMQLWVAEYCDAVRYFMNVELGAISKYVVGSHANH